MLYFSFLPHIQMGMAVFDRNLKQVDSLFGQNKNLYNILCKKKKIINRKF